MARTNFDNKYGNVTLLASLGVRKSKRFNTNNVFTHRANYRTMTSILILLHSIGIFWLFQTTVGGGVAQRELSFTPPYCRDPIAAAAFTMRLVSEPWRLHQVVAL